MSFCLLLPLLGTGLSLLGLTLWTIGRYEKVHNNCRLVLWQNQAEKAKILRSLIELNPKARRLRRKKRRANKSLARALSSGQPAAIAAASTYYGYITKKQLQLRARQEHHLAQARGLDLKARNRLGQMSLRSSLITTRYSHFHHGRTPFVSLFF